MSHPPPPTSSPAPRQRGQPTPQQPPIQPQYPGGPSTRPSMPAPASTTGAGPSRIGSSAPTPLQNVPTLPLPYAAPHSSGPSSSNPRPPPRVPPLPPSSGRSEAWKMQPTFYPLPVVGSSASYVEDKRGPSDNGAHPSGRGPYQYAPGPTSQGAAPGPGAYQSPQAASHVLGGGVSYANSYPRPSQPHPSTPLVAVRPPGRQSSLSMAYDSALAGPSVERQRALVRSPIDVDALSNKDGEEMEVDDSDEDEADGGSKAGGPISRKRGRGGDGASVAGGDDEEGDTMGIVPGTTPSGKKRRPHAPRRRVVQSCSECRRRKIKCDKKVPCGPCVLRSDEAQCHEVGMAEKNVIATPHAFATATDLALVAQRLDALEAALKKSGTLAPADVDNIIKKAYRAGSVPSNIDPALLVSNAVLDASEQLVKAEAQTQEQADEGIGLDLSLDDPRGDRGAAPSVPLPRRAETAPVPRTSRPSPSLEDNGDADLDPQDDTEGAALTLEHLAFGRSRVAGAHAIPHFGASQSAISKHAPNNDYHLARSHPLSHGDTPPGSGGRAVSFSGSKSISAGNSPAKDFRRGSIAPPALGSANSAPMTLTMGGGERKLESTPSGVKGRDGQGGGGASGSGMGSYGQSLSAEDRAMRIDALLDLIGPTDVFQLFYRQSDVGLRALTKMLPGTERGELLVKNYLEKVDWLHRCLHIPTFLRQCHDLWALPHDMVVHEMALPFVALYFSVCCLGIQFMDADEANKHFTPEEIRDLPELYFSAARSCMWAADFLERHTTENLQCILLLGVFMNNRDRGEAAWALLGAGIKMAQGLGLSRLGAEPTEADTIKTSPMWTGRWESVIEREVGRRIWWNLVFLDWALSPSYNFSCSIHPDQIKTALPSNIEDEDIVEGRPLRPQPLHVRTGMSFCLARIKFIQIMYRQICEANLHPHPPYSFILSVDGELRQAMMDLPTFFQPNSTAPTALDRSTPPPADHDPKRLVQYYEKVMLHLAIHSRMLRLHRPWLSRGYTDERFAYSKEQCIRAARASLRLMGDTHGTAAFLEKWWLPLFYVSVSGLVVIIDLLRTNKHDMHSSETEQKISEVKGALDQMRHIADVSHPSRSAVKVMEFLLAEVEERRRPPGCSAGKRKADDDDADGLQRAVKKLIRQAQLEIDSPTTSAGSFPAASPPPSSSLHRVSVSPHHNPAHDRPVFDAYPLLPSTAALQQQAAGPTSAIPPRSRRGSTAGGSSLLDFNFDTPPSFSPQVQNTGVMPSTNGAMLPPSTSLGGYSITHPSQSQAPSAPSPFSFPVDTDQSFPNNPFAFPSFAPNTSALGPQLDPSVEDLLSNYFPTPQQQQQGGNGAAGGNGEMQQGWGTVPDDFLSRVFSFSWEAAPGGGVDGQGGNVGQQGQQGGVGSGMGQGQGQQNAQGTGGMSQRQYGPGQGQSQDQGQRQGFTGGQSMRGAGGQGMGGTGQTGQGQGGDFVPFDWGTTSGGWMA